MSLRWTEDQYEDYLRSSSMQVAPGDRIAEEGEPPAKKPSKYHNKKVVTPDGSFDSKWEYSCWCKLKMQERAGLISDLQRQVPFELIPAADLDGRKLPAVKYLADFVYLKDGVQVVEDAKGMKSLADYKIKRRLMFWIHDIIVKEIRK